MTEQQELLAGQVAKALQDLPRAGPPGRTVVGHQGREPPHRPHRRAQRHRVEQVQRRESHHRQQGPGQRAAALAGFFCADHIRFTHTTDSAPGGEARTYPSFSAAAAEAGRSRVFGGQHFEFSTQTGLAIGRNVADKVLATRLLYRTGPTHHGECPL